MESPKKLTTHPGPSGRYSHLYRHSVGSKWEESLPGYLRKPSTPPNTCPKGLLLGYYRAIPSNNKINMLPFCYTHVHWMCLFVFY